MTKIAKCLFVAIALIASRSVTTASSPSKGRASALPARPASNEIPADIWKGAAEDGNEIAGTHVEIKTEPSTDGSKILVTTDGDTEGLLAGTDVDPGADPDDPDDDEARTIVVDIEELKRMFPGIMDDPELLRILLGFLLAHEFDHVPGDGEAPAPGDGPAGDQGGHGHMGGLACDHPSDFADDGEAICDAVEALQSDTSTPLEERCKIAAALCKLHKHFQSEANTPGSLAAAPNCPGVTLTNGKIIDDCGACATGECPDHGHDYGGV